MSLEELADSQDVDLLPPPPLLETAEIRREGNLATATREGLDRKWEVLQTARSPAAELPQQVPTACSSTVCTVHPKDMSLLLRCVGLQLSDAVVRNGLAQIGKDSQCPLSAEDFCAFCEYVYSSGGHSSKTTSDVPSSIGHSTPSKELIAAAFRVFASATSAEPGTINSHAWTN